MQLLCFTFSPSPGPRIAPSQHMRDEAEFQAEEIIINVLSKLVSEVLDTEE